MVPKLVYDFVHFKHGAQRLDVADGLEGSARDAQFILGPAEDIVPKPGFKVRIQVREIDAQTTALRQKQCGVMENEQGKNRRRRRALRRSGPGPQVRSGPLGKARQKRRRTQPASPSRREYGQSRGENPPWNPGRKPVGAVRVLQEYPLVAGGSRVAAMQRMQGPLGSGCPPQLRLSLLRFRCPARVRRALRSCGRGDSQCARQHLA